MNVIVAFDAFKDALSASDVCMAVAKGIRMACTKSGWITDITRANFPLAGYIVNGATIRLNLVLKFTYWEFQRMSFTLFPLFP